MGRLARGLLGAALMTGCGHEADIHPVASCFGGGWVHPAPSLQADPEAVTLELPQFGEDGRLHASRRPFSYRFDREPSGTTETLRAAALLPGKGKAIVVGDHGTVRVRHPLTGWEAESPGTEEDLHVVVHVPGELHIAVGGHGVAAVWRANVGWRVEDTGTTRDLLAVAQFETSMLAVGRGGVMVQRSKEGVWRPVDTRTTEDLAAVGWCQHHVCAVGARGTIVDCVPRGEQLTCIPRPPLVDADLLALVDYGTIYGRGVKLERTMPPEGVWSPPPEWRVVEGPPWLSADNEVRAFSQDLAVGKAGLVVVRSRALVGPYSRLKPPGSIQLPYGVDFNGVASALVDGYIVGDKGTIVHVGVEGVFIDEVCR
ncbi:hypothetical protein [Polyangium sp. 15x6]|uniref:hypothetical protein n=1 Tax=Polyangium sp. 15x6 TaxID=3042687 RepID=UPI00249C4B84|nr:hypothetical protein [Polyangium sp. 15x6]MDI3284144.1 hypothetical protein [Polyangium sp. 15x6]